MSYRYLPWRSGYVYKAAWSFGYSTLRGFVMQPWAFTCHVHRWCTFGALYSENVTDRAENADKTPRKRAKKPWKHRKNAGYSRVRIVAKIPKSAWLCGFSGFVFLLWCTFFLKRHGRGEKRGILRINRIRLVCILKLYRFRLFMSETAFLTPHNTIPIIVSRYITCIRSAAV